MDDKVDGVLLGVDDGGDLEGWPDFAGIPECATSAWRSRACWLKDSSSSCQHDASNRGQLSELLQQEHHIEQVDWSRPRGP